MEIGPKQQNMACRTNLCNALDSSSAREPTREAQRENHNSSQLLLLALICLDHRKQRCLKFPIFTPVNRQTACSERQLGAQCPCPSHTRIPPSNLPVPVTGVDGERDNMLYPAKLANPSRAASSLGSGGLTLNSTTTHSMCSDSSSFAHLCLCSDPWQQGRVSGAKSGVLVTGFGSLTVRLPIGCIV